jgi:hypothetical protein
MLKLYEDSNIQEIAMAIREKSGLGVMFYPHEMANAIRNIPTSGGGDTGGIKFEDYIAGNVWDAEINLPNIWSLKPYAFARMGVTKVSIPNVFSLSEGAFYNCYALEQVDLRENLPNIPYRAFSDCSNLNISLPDTITGIDDMAFNGCSSLNLTTLPSNLKTIGDNAFANSGVAPTELPEQLETIYPSAFNSCVNLAITTIPASVKNLYGNAFSNCQNLTSITFEGTPEQLEWGVFNNCENLLEVNVPWSIDDPINGDGSWCGAPNATINYNYTRS